MFKLANVFYYYIHIMPIYEIYLSNQQKTRLSNFLSFRFVWDTSFCQKTAVVSSPSFAAKQFQQQQQTLLIPVERSNILFIDFYCTNE